MNGWSLLEGLGLEIFPLLESTTPWAGPQWKWRAQSCGFALHCCWDNRLSLTELSHVISNPDSSQISDVVRAQHQAQQVTLNLYATPPHLQSTATTHAPPAVEPGRKTIKKSHWGKDEGYWHEKILCHQLCMRMGQAGMEKFRDLPELMTQTSLGFGPNAWTKSCTQELSRSLIH